MARSDGVGAVGVVGAGVVGAGVVGVAGGVGAVGAVCVEIMEQRGQERLAPVRRCDAGQRRRRRRGGLVPTRAVRGARDGALGAVVVQRYREALVEVGAIFASRVPRALVASRGASGGASQPSPRPAAPRRGVVAPGAVAPGVAAAGVAPRGPQSLGGRPGGPRAPRGVVRPRGPGVAAPRPGGPRPAVTHGVAAAPRPRAPRGVRRKSTVAGRDTVVLRRAPAQVVRWRRSAPGAPRRRQGLQGPRVYTEPLRLTHAAEGAGPEHAPQALDGSRWFVHATRGHHNRHLVVTDGRGRTLAKASAGSAGSRGAARRSGFASEKAVHRVRQVLRRRYRQRRPRQLWVRFEGSDVTRGPVRRALKLHGVAVRQVEHRVAEPHGGCRRRKPRRVRGG